MRHLLRWLAVAGGLVLALWLGKNLIAKAAVIGGVKAMTGFQVQLQAFEVGLFTTRVHIRGLTVRNPPGFPDPILVEVPEIYVDYDLAAFLRGRVHLEELRVHLHQLRVSKNAQGAVNVNLLALMKAGRAPAPKPAPGEAPAFHIDRLRLRIGKVVYTDYTHSPPQAREFLVNIEEQFTDVNNPHVLGGLILTRALASTTIARLANIDLGSLQDDIAVVTNNALTLAEQVSTKAVGTAERTVKKTANRLKQLLFLDR